MQITNNEREVQSVTLDGITWVLNPGVSITISKTECIIAFTEEYAGEQLPPQRHWPTPIGGLDDVTLDAKVLEHVPAYPDTITVTALAMCVFGQKNGLRVTTIHAALRHLVAAGDVTVNEKRDRWHRL